MEYLNLIITAMVSILVSLGGSVLFFKEKKKGMDIDNKNKLSEAHEKECNRLNGIIDRQSKTTRELYSERKRLINDNYEHLKEVFDLKLEINQLKDISCYILGCKYRLPPRTIPGTEEPKEAIKCGDFEGLFKRMKLNTNNNTEKHEEEDNKHETDK